MSGHGPHPTSEPRAEGGHRHAPGDNHGTADPHGDHHGTADPHGHGHGTADPHGHGHGAAHAHDGGHDHPAGHDHGHEHGRGHDHGGGGGLRGLAHRLGHLVTPHSHDTSDKVDAALEASREGIRALWISLAVLGATAVLQGVVAFWSGSVGLLGDTLHNLADALTAVPLGIAFLVGRRPANPRYTYGYGRAEDLAGIAIVALIAASSALAGYAAVRRLAHPVGVEHLLAVGVAALLGFAGNEIVARYRIQVGRRIGSAALVADGLHARTDGFTSLAVLLGAGGVGLGWRWADPVVGLLITVAILFVLFSAAREVYRRLMDAVDPDLVGTARATLADTPGVRAVGEVRLRWIGHALRAECTIAVSTALDITAAHAVAVDAEHRLLHALPRLSAATVHADPYAADVDHHEPLRHHGT